MINDHSQRGLSLVELIVCIVIVAILANIAFPSMKNVIDNSQRKAVINGTLGLFAVARQEAVLNGTLVTLCPLGPGNQCGKDWSRQVAVFKDPENQREITSDSEIIRVLPPPERGFLKAASLNRSYFQYRPDGMTHSDLGNITWCPDDLDPSKAAHLVIRRSGSVRLARDGNGDGIPDRSNGKPVTCN